MCHVGFGAGLHEAEAIQHWLVQGTCMIDLSAHFMEIKHSPSTMLLSLDERKLMGVAGSVAEGPIKSKTEMEKHPA